jgi:hypothetical protein
MNLVVNTRPVVGFGVPWDFFFSHFFLSKLAAAVVGGMCFLSFSQLAVAACRCRRCILFFRTVSMQVAAPTPQTVGRLFAVGPDVAKFLAFVALRKGVVGFVGLYLDGNVAEVGQFKQVLVLCCPR